MDGTLATTTSAASGVARGVSTAERLCFDFSILNWCDISGIVDLMAFHSQFPLLYTGTDTKTPGYVECKDVNQFGRHGLYDSATMLAGRTAVVKAIESEWTFSVGPVGRSYRFSARL